MVYSALISYGMISVLVAATPGPSNMLAAQNGATFGLPKATLAVLGHVLAILILAIISAVGISSLLVQSPILFNAIKFTGAGYLFYMGMTIFLSANLASGIQPRQHSGRRLFTQGFVVGFCNPKALVFFTALFPQFIDVNQGLSAQFAGYMTISISSAFIFPMCYAVAGNQAKSVELSARSQRWTKRVMGLFFIGFGAAMMFQ